MNYKKRYVEVIARFDTEGRITPLKILLCDGTSVCIDRVLSVCRAASLKAGGAGIRYTCRVNGIEMYLFLEETAWFIEEAVQN